MNKINYNISNIIKKYLLPSLSSLKILKQICLTHLKVSTEWIRSILDFENSSDKRIISFKLPHDISWNIHPKYKIYT